MEYPHRFREQMVRKMLGPDATSASQLSRETGVAQATLSRWLRAALTVDGMNNKHKKSEQRNGGPRRPADWNAEEKLEAVLEADRLDDDELGGWLRKKGLREADLLAWRQVVIGALGEKPKKRGRTKDVKKIRALERELDRKEKALAEAAALLVLKKKVQAIWGDEDAGTAGRSGR
jgi:transposase-like protein